MKKQQDLHGPILLGGMIFNRKCLKSLIFITLINKQ